MVVAVPQSGAQNYGSPQTDMDILGLGPNGVTNNPTNDPWGLPQGFPYNQTGGPQGSMVGSMLSGQPSSPAQPGHSWTGMLEALRQRPTQPDTPEPTGMPGLGGVAGGMLTSGVGGVGSAVSGMQMPNLSGFAQPAPNYTGTPLAAQWEAEQSLTGAKRRQLEADRALIGAYPALRGAERGVLDAQQAQLGASSAFLQEQTRSLQARMSEQAQLQAARNNTADQIATGRGQRERDVMAYRFQLAGLPQPVEVTMPPGSDATNMPPGTVARIQTLEQKLQVAFKDNEVLRQFNEEAARIKTANTGQAVTAAQIAKGRVALSLDEMETAAKLAGIDVRSAALDVEASRQSPEPGLELDPTTGYFVDRNTAAINTAREKQRLNAELNGAWGSVGIDTLMSAISLDNPVIDEPTFIKAAMAHNLSRETAEFYLSLARAKKAESKKNSFLELFTPEQLTKLGLSPTTTI